MAAAQSVPGALATLPDGAYATQVWIGDRTGDGFVYLLTAAGMPRGTLFQPRVRDLGILSREEIVRAVRARVADDREIVVEPIRTAAGGDILGYVVRPRDVHLSARFNGTGGYTLYLQGGRSTAESGGGGGGAGGGGGM